MLDDGCGETDVIGTVAPENEVEDGIEKVDSAKVVEDVVVELSFFEDDDNGGTRRVEFM